jgi:hypothetical protein
MTDDQREHINRACGLAVAAENVLNLAQADVNELERQLIAQ